eukprot:2375803-Prymnesium_polylepis.1
MLACARARGGGGRRDGCAAHRGGRAEAAGDDQRVQAVRGDARQASRGLPAVRAAHGGAAPAVGHGGRHGGPRRVRPLRAESRAPPFAL